jgi:DNA polymerase zeta
MPAAVDDVEAFSSDEDEDDLLEGEENPFHLFAMTQAPMLEMKVEVDSKYIAGDTGAAPDEEEEEEAALRRHTEDVQQRADAGRDFRATQAAPKGEESDHEYDDEELDALFRKTVTGGFESRPSTPRRRDGGATSHTPTTQGTGSSGGSVDARRYQREKRIRELAGWGDLRRVLSSGVLCDR